MRWRTGKGFREEEEAQLEAEENKDEMDEDEKMGNDNGVAQENEEMIAADRDLDIVEDMKESKEQKEPANEDEEEYVDVDRNGKPRKKKACKRADWSGTQEFDMRTYNVHIRNALAWKAANNEQRKDLLRENGTKWSILLEIPDFDPIRDVPIDVMHNLFQGELTVLDTCLQCTRPLICQLD